MASIHINVTDQELADLNGALDWKLYQRDHAGRVVGGGEREFSLRDNRVEAMLARLRVAGLRVLEPACFEGHLTVALCAAGARVTAFDARPASVVKAFARCLAFGHYPKLLLHDARRIAELGEFDLVFHSGLFYHLADPIEHLRSLIGVAPLIVLDTHTAFPALARDTLAGYEGHWHDEGGWAEPLSGIEERSFWLKKDSLFRLFTDCGFAHETLLDDEYPDGPRSCHLLFRT
ncbi:MAG TPA: methyltransferase domain-containing protein [Pirellulales bacterium]